MVKFGGSVRYSFSQRTNKKPTTEKTRPRRKDRSSRRKIAYSVIKSVSAEEKRNIDQFG